MEGTVNRQHRLLPRWGLAVLCLLLPGMVQATSPQELENELLRGAQMWGAKNRPDLALQLIHKLLATNPDSPEGLVFIAELALRDNKPAEAAKILDTLRARHPRHKATRDLEILVRVYGPDREKLARMRLLARTGGKADSTDLARVRNAETAKISNNRKAETAQLARELFPDGPPSIGGLGLEYYQIMSTSEAASQLARLFRETGDSRYRLAQLEMQLRQALNPTVGLREIEKLADQPDINQQSLQDLWRRTLGRLSNTSANTVWVKAFLKHYPGDPDMVERLAAMQLAVERADRMAHDPINMARNAAQAALDSGQLDLAQTQLEAMLAARPKDAESLGNLGLVRLRQGRHAEALDLFGRAYQQARQVKWKELQNTAQFWGLLRQADLAIERKDLDAAADFAVQATRLQPDNIEAILTLAGVKVIAGDTELAQILYQQALKHEPNNISALRGLASLYIKQDHKEQALALLAQASTNDPTLANTFSGTRAAILKTQAEALIEANRLSPAMQTLETAVLIAPQDAWIRYSLARLYQRLDLARESLNVMNEGVDRFPQDIEMRHARALIRSALDDDAGSIADINQIPWHLRTESIHALEQQAWVRLEVALAQQPAQRAQAEPHLLSAEKRAGNDPDLLLAVANAWFKLGQPSRGVAVFDRLAFRQPKLAPDAALQYAVLLNRAKNDAALANQLPRLLSLPGWTAQQEVRLLDLYTDHQERLIEQQRLSGNTAQATRMAQAPIPGTDAINLAERHKARARLLMAAGANAEAADVIEQALQFLPEDMDLHMDLGNTLARQGLLRDAIEQARWLDSHILEDDLNRRLALLRLWQRSQSMEAARKESRRLLQRFANNLDVLQHAARLERADGHYAQAVSLFRRARQLEQINTSAVPGTIETATLNVPFGKEDQLPEPSLHFAEHLSLLVADLSAAPEKFTDNNWPVEPAKDLALTLVWALPPEALRSELATAEDPISQIQLEIDSIEARRLTWIEVGQKRLQKSATDGISTLNGWERPIVAWLPWGYDGRYFFHADQVSLDAGQLPSSTADNEGFGQIAPSPLAAYPADALAQSARGVNLGVGYEGDKLSWDVGTIGVGFPVTNTVGGISQRSEAGPFSFTLDLSRRPLTGSLLSYAGARDPVTREAWGGVVATGVGGRIATDIGNYSLSASANYALLSGRNVEDNNRLQLRATMDRDLYVKPGRLLNLGLTLSAWHFAKDLSAFTWGHGGYYSPQRYISLALPLEWSGHEGPLTWQVRGAVSVSRSAGNDTNFFPTAAALQAAQANPASAIYPGSGSSGSSFSLRSALEYQITAQTALGAQLELDRSAYYSPNNLLLYVRYLYGPVLPAPTDRPHPVQTYSSF